MGSIYNYALQLRSLIIQNPSASLRSAPLPKGMATHTLSGEANLQKPPLKGEVALPP